MKSGRQLFRKIELDILDAVSAKMSHHSRDILERQVARAKLVQRLVHATEVNIYYFRKRGQEIPNSVPEFPTAQAELPIADVMLQLLDQRATIQCTLLVVAGHLFSFQFNAPTSKLSSERVRISSVVVHIDPCAQERGD